MNKSDFIEKVAQKSGLSKKDAGAAVEAVLASIQDAMKDGDPVRFVGFGTFETRVRKARTGRNPQKPGELVEIPEAVAPVFKAGKALKDALNK